MNTTFSPLSGSGCLLSKDHKSQVLKSESSIHKIEKPHSYPLHIRKSELLMMCTIPTPSLSAVSLLFYILKANPFYNLLADVV